MRLRKQKRWNKKVAFGLILISLQFSEPIASFGSAGWLPVVKGEPLVVEFCLPSAKPGTLILQGMGNSNKWRTLATIKNPKLKKDSYCADDFKTGYKQGLYHFKYRWIVNVSGGWALQLYSPATKKVFYGWPDGIETTG